MIAITMGDPSGIGPEISLKSLIKNPEYRDNVLIIGNRSVLNYYSKLLNNQLELNYIKDPEQFLKGKINILSVSDSPFSVEQIGKVSGESGKEAFKYIERAILLAREDRIKAVVTGPLNKEALHLGGHKYNGHTEIFADLTDTTNYTMMLWSPELSVVHVSTHVSLKEACMRVSKSRVVDCIKLSANALSAMGVKKPKIAVAGLNPHSGENGLFGKEEIIEIDPAVRSAREEGYDVYGPVPPDTVFLQAYKGKFDIVVAMYHDQGHIPMKLLAFDKGVNITLGLPIIRTSVDHGTAFDIAGRGIASEESLNEAINVSRKFY